MRTNRRPRLTTAEAKSNLNFAQKLMSRTRFGSFLWTGALHWGATTLFCVAETDLECPGPRTCVQMESLIFNPWSIFQTRLWSEWSWVQLNLKNCSCQCTQREWRKTFATLLHRLYKLSLGTKYLGPMKRVLEQAESRAKHITIEHKSRMSNAM